MKSNFIWSKLYFFFISVFVPSLSVLFNCITKPMCIIFPNFFFSSCTSTILQSNHHQSKFSIVINTNVTFTVNDPVLHPAVCAKYRQLRPTEIWLLDLSPNFCRTVKCHWCIIPLLTYYLVVVFSVCLCRVLSVTLWRGFHVEKSQTVDRSDLEVYRERFAQRNVFFGYSHLQTASRDITSKKKKVIGFP